MKSELSVKNFGKIKDANIRLCPFTIIVGPNSSGKSFITKALYSLFHSMNKDLSTDFLVKSIISAIQLINIIDERLVRPSRKDKLTLEALREQFSQLENAISEIYEEVTILDTVTISSKIDEVYADIDELYQTLNEQLSIGQGTKFLSVQDEMVILEREIKNLKRFSEDIEDIYVSSFTSDLKQEFLENFQVPSLSALYSFSSSQESEFEFSNLGTINLKGDGVTFSLFKNTIAEFQQLYNVVYLESPIYFKLKNALRNVRLSNFSFRRKGFLNQVPKYFYDLEQLLDSKISGNSSEFSPILELIESKINGVLQVSNGDIFFIDHKNKDTQIPLNLTSSGISNLGLISLLIKQNILSKGSYLFIDEPEVNLHTEWQHVMLDVLVELSKRGVSIVIATHSLDMIYRFEHIVSKESELVNNEHFSLNRLTEDGTSISSDGLIADIRKAKEDLGRPYLSLLAERLP